MTDYIPFTPAEYAPDAPATASHFQRWFENPIAMMEGAAGAPRLWRGALKSFVAGNVVFYGNAAGGTNGFTSWQEVARFNFVQVGGIRVAFTHAPAEVGRPVEDAVPRRGVAGADRHRDARRGPA